MLRSKPSIPSVGAALAAVISLGLAGCGPQTAAPKPAGSAEPAAAAPAPSGVSVTVNEPLTLSPEENQANLERLAGLPPGAPAKWSLAEGIVVAAATENAASGGAKALRLTPTGGVGFHRVGFEGQYGDGAKTYRVTIWAKGPPGTGVKLEARGKELLSGGSPADYATQYFDLAKGVAEANKLASDDTRFGAATITRDGDWNKISVDMTTRDGWLYFVVGMTTEGAHVFAGTSAIEMTLGGVTVKPAA